LKKFGFSLEEIRGMTLLQMGFWLEGMVYDAELVAGAVQDSRRKETRTLDELVQVLPKTEAKRGGVRVQG